MATKRDKIDDPASRFVWVVEEIGWEHSTVLGVYSSTDQIVRAHPPSKVSKRDIRAHGGEPEGWRELQEDYWETGWSDNLVATRFTLDGNTR